MQNSKWLLAATLAVSMFSTGCKGSLCSQIESENTSLKEKIAPCGDSSSTGSFNKATCDANISACNAADEKVLEQQIDCIHDVKACVKGQEQVFLGQLLACSGGQVSQACQDALDKATGN